MRAIYRTTVVALLALVFAGCSDDTGQRGDAGQQLDASQDATDVRPDVDGRDARDTKTGADTDDADSGVDADSGSDAEDPEQMRIYRVVPQNGVMEGGEEAYVRGENFADGATLFFDDVPVPGAEVVDSQTIRFVTPPHDPIRVDVKVEQQDGSARLADAFQYWRPTTTRGNPIDGELEVRVFSDQQIPLRDAYVKVLGTDHAGLTGPDGSVVFSGQDLSGPQTVAATAHGHSSFLFQDVETDELTLVLCEKQPRTGAPPSPPQATIRGELTGMEALPPLGAGESHIAVIRTTTYSPGHRNPAPGHDATLDANGEFELTSRTGELAVFALAGIYDEESETFTPHLMAVQRGLYVQADQAYEVDLVLDITLDQTASVEYVDAPMTRFEEPRLKQQTWLDFGFEGAAQLEATSSDMATVESAPIATLGGELAGVDYTFIGFVRAADPVARVAIAQIRDVTDLSQTIRSEPMVDIPVLLAASEESLPVAPGQTIEVDYAGPNAPDFIHVSVRTLFGAWMWDVVMPADARSLTFPEFPDFSALPEDIRPNPYPSGNYNLTLSASDYVGVDSEHFTLRLGKSYDSVGASYQRIKFE